MKNQFVIHMSLAIFLSWVYPPLGLALYPEYTASWIAVVFIFVMSGLSLKTGELKQAAGKVGFNLFIQIYNLGFVPAFSFGVSRLLVRWGALPLDLADGIVIASCLPMTVNMVIVLTKAASGDEACALLNASVGNLLGVFITPALILAYLGQESDIKFGGVILKLTYRVLIPIAFGQILQFFFKPVVIFVTKHKPKFAKI